MFGISGFELFLIAAFALLIFGPDKLPQMGRTVGRFMADFKRMQTTMEDQIRAELYRTEKAVSAKPAAVAAASGATQEDDEEEDEE